MTAWRNPTLFEDPGEFRAWKVKGTAADENKVIGWRTDGTGLFPDTDPPVTWERRSKAVSGLRSRAGKPGAGDAGVPIPDGIIREWLVLGPILLPDEFKAVKEEVIPGEADLQAQENESYKDLKWTRITIDNSCVDFKALYGPDNLDKDDPRQAAFAQRRGALCSTGDRKHAAHGRF